MKDVVPRAEEPAWSKEEAIVVILLSAATADGDLADAEREELLALEHRSKSLKSLGPTRLSALNRRVQQRLRYGEGTLAQACAVLPKEARAPIFAVALDVMLGDGELTAAEADFVNTLMLLLNLDGAAVEPIAEVISLKNKI